jgi:hypothetical protein
MGEYGGGYDQGFGGGGMAYGMGGYGEPQHQQPVYEEEAPKVEYVEVPVGSLAPRQIKKLLVSQLKAMLNQRGVNTDEMRKPELVDKLVDKYKMEGLLNDDSIPLHGDKIEVQWDGDETFYPCMVYNGETEGTLVVECHADGEVSNYDFDPADGGWRWPEEPPPKKPRIYKDDIDDEDDFQDAGAKDEESDEEQSDAAPADEEDDEDDEEIDEGEED